MSSLELDVWSDIACPWCYVGKRRLEAAIVAYDGEVNVRWRAYQLDPSAPPEYSPDISYVDRLAKKYGRSQSEAKGMIDSMTSTAAKDGLDFHFETIRAGNTFDAHRLLHFAHQEGKQDALKERLFKAYLEEGELMSDTSALVRLAGEVGLDKELAAACLASDEYSSEVRSDLTEAMALGIRGVPFYVVDKRFGVSGAQAPDAFLQVFAKAASEKIQLVAANDEGAVCGPDGCT